MKVEPKSGLSRALRCGLVLAIFVLCTRTFLFPQKKPTTSEPSHFMGSMPFVGCASDGQVGSLKAPKGQSMAIAISAATARQLAYYRAEEGPGILAPRGWHCFSTYGSNGSSLYVTPDPIRPADFFSGGWKGFEGPAIQISVMDGGTSGRFEVAKTIARVFPAHMDFVRDVISEGIEPASSFPTGPFPHDKLTYRSKEIVEFQTPPNTEGLGTQSRLQKNGHPIEGVAILSGEDPDLIQASIRLTPQMRDLTPSIIHQIEREVARSKSQ